MWDVVGITRTLRIDQVEQGYRHGMFPMADDWSGLYTWHQPPTRAVIPLDGFHVPRSLKKTLRRGTFNITYDQAFLDVMKGCAHRDPTWINDEFLRVYGELHRDGKAHSVEVWADDALVGGLYGVHLGGAFFAESKFHRVTDASKVALWGLVDRLRACGFDLLEVQYLTDHLKRFGALEIDQAQYLAILQQALAHACPFTP